MKQYIAILNQNGQNAPVATVLENSLGPIVWTRSSEGQYLGTLAGRFPASSTIAFLGDGQGGENDTPTMLILHPTSDDYVVITTKNAPAEGGENQFRDNLLVRTAIDIRVYE